MGLIQRLKVALGLVPRERERGGPDQGSAGQDVAVTVEHEPDTDSEDAVKGTQTGSHESSDEAEEPSTAEELPTEEGDTEKSEATETDDTKADGERTTEETDNEGTTVEETPDDEESTADEQLADVQSINGIGPAYAERLGEADIETVADLAAADTATVAEETGIAESRVSTWIDRAGE